MLLPYCHLTDPNNNRAMDTEISIVTTFRGPRIVHNRPYWHLASFKSVFYHNVRCGRGELASISCAIAANPGLENAQTPYSMSRLSDVKEAVFENVRRAKFPDRPQRLKALFVFDDRALAERALKEWFTNEQRPFHECRIVIESNIHKADSLWLNASAEQFEENAAKYWQGEMTARPFPEVIVNGALYFPDWESFPAGFPGL
jgi:hypothetical protein